MQMELKKDLLTEEEGFFHMHVGASQKWNKNPKEAFRSRGLCTILTKDDKNLWRSDKTKEKGFELVGCSKLQEGKYMEETNGGWGLFL